MKKSELRNLIHEIYGEMDKRKFRMMDGTITSVNKVMQNEYLSVAYQASNSKPSRTNPSILIPMSHFTSTGDPLPKVDDKCSGKFYGGDSKFGGGKVIYFCWKDKYCWEPDKKFDVKEEISDKLEESPLEKNLLKNISKSLIKRNPDIDKGKILSTTKSWLGKGKNLITATNAMGDNYEKDVLKAIENELEILKENQSNIGKILITTLGYKGKIYSIEVFNKEGKLIDKIKEGRFTEHAFVSKYGKLSDYESQGVEIDYIEFDPS
jgi:hypothetical protein